MVLRIKRDISFPLPDTLYHWLRLHSLHWDPWIAFAFPALPTGTCLCHSRPSFYDYRFGACVASRRIVAFWVRHSSHHRGIWHSHMIVSLLCICGLQWLVIEQLACLFPLSSSTIKIETIPWASCWLQTVRIYPLFCRLDGCHRASSFLLGSSLLSEVRRVSLLLCIYFSCQRISISDAWRRACILACSHSVYIKVSSDLFWLHHRTIKSERVAGKVRSARIFRGAAQSDSSTCFCIPPTSSALFLAYRVVMLVSR
jgi:hypothetical protein